MNEEITVACAAWHKQKHLDLYFRQHSASLLQQTIPVKIIYVCDGGMSLPAPAPNVTIVTVSEDIRTAEALNIGLALANTPFFAALNIDDFYFSNALELIVNTIKRIDVDAFFTDWEIRFSEEGDFHRACQPLDAFAPCLNWPPERKDRLRLGNGDGFRGTWGPAPVFRTAALKEMGGYPKWFSDGTPIRTILDFVVWDRFSKAGRKVSRGELVCGSYYSSPDSQLEFRGDHNDAEHARYEKIGALV